MAEHNPTPVVVAVGHGPIDAALAFAADEAVRAGCGLHLIHVVHLTGRGPETPLVAELDLEQEGRQALDAALERAHGLVDGVPVTTELRSGRVVQTTVDMAKEARLIVLERRDLSTLGRVVTRSVSSGVAAHARIPVVSVPSHWSPTGLQGGSPSVTVGVEFPDRAGQVLRAAAVEAKSRGAVLRVVHTWSLPSGYDVVPGFYLKGGGSIGNQAESQEWVDRATADIETAIAALGEDVAGVPVEILVRHARAADALIEAGRETELLVIGRHDPLLPVGSHLGPIARAILREADCPVLLVDPS